MLHGMNVQPRARDGCPTEGGLVLWGGEGGGGWRAGGRGVHQENWETTRPGLCLYVDLHEHDSLLWTQRSTIGVVGIDNDCGCN